MGRIIVTEDVSLDGIMENNGIWTSEFERGAEGDQFKLDETCDAKVLLMGRETYQIFAAAWPFEEGELAEKLNSMPKYVVSSTLKEATWNNSTILRGDMVQNVSQLRQEIDGNIVVHGSARLVQTLIEHDLVDELRLMVYPVVLGTGKRLFGDMGDKKRLRLADSKTVGDGIAILIYELANVEVKGAASG
jgi:dihydrofolate reductase